MAWIFINWFLSLEGQIAFRQANTDELRVGSLREDLPQELLPPLAKRRKDKEYLWINRPDWMDFKPIHNLLEELRTGQSAESIRKYHVMKRTKDTEDSKLLCSIS
jgi:hypothetical protein